MIVKLNFPYVVMFGITFTLGCLAGQTAEPTAWVVPILLIGGGSLYLSDRGFRQLQRGLRQFSFWLGHSDIGQASPKLLTLTNWKKF